MYLSANQRRTLLIAMCIGLVSVGSFVAGRSSAQSATSQEQVHLIAASVHAECGGSVVSSSVRPAVQSEKVKEKI